MGIFRNCRIGILACTITTTIKNNGGIQDNMGIQDNRGFRRMLFLVPHGRLDDRLLITIKLWNLQSLVSLICFHSKLVWLQ